MLRDSGMEESRHPKIAELRKFMLNRPSKAVMAPVAEGFGALAATLTQPFVSHDVGYLQGERGQKSRKVRNLMLQSPFKSMLARTAIFAAVLALAISFVTVGLAPSASAQTANGDPCKQDANTKVVSCDYDENGTDPVASFSGMDPEGENIVWSLAGDDAADFDITGGVLSFKKSPNFENTRGDGGAADNTYDVMVVATEVRAPGSLDLAQSSEITVVVNVKNVEEDPTITFTRLQVRAGVDTTVSPAPDPTITASLTDDDGPTGITYKWYVPKVSRPDLENDDHWTVAPTTPTGDAGQTYTADATDAGKVLRVVATYTDGAGTGNDKAYARSAHPVAAVRADNNVPQFPAGTPTSFTLGEHVAVGTVVGTVRGSDTDSGDILSHELGDVSGGDDAALFKIDMATGRITVAKKLDFESATDRDTATDGKQYGITVKVYDPTGAVPADVADRIASGAITVYITVTDQNDAPGKPDVGIQATNSRTPVDPDDNTMPSYVVDENHPVKDVVDDPDTTEVETAYAVVIATFEVDNETDPDGGDSASEGDPANTLKLTAGGVDGGLFNLTNTADFDGSDTDTTYDLMFKESPNYESPADADGNNKYHVTIVTADNEGATSELPLVITVMNVNEDGEVKLSTTQPAVGEPITATLTDPDMKITEVKWQWGRSNTRGSFIPIQGATSATYTPVMTVKDDPVTTANEGVDGDEGMYLEAKVTYVDNASADEHDPDATPPKLRTRTAVKASDNAVREAPEVNQAPMFGSGITREVPENSKENTNVGGPVTATDPDGDALAYTITGGADMGAFKIVLASGQIQVKKGTKLDFEGSQTTYVVEVTATDPFGMSVSTMVTINVTDDNEKPEVTPPGDPCKQDANTKVVSCDYDENGTDPVASFSGMDPEGENIVWSLAGDDAADFDITGGVLSFKKSPNFENTRGDGGAADNTYDVMVVATEVRAPGSLDLAQSSEITVVVNVKNVEEDPTITFTRLQVRAGVDTTVSPAPDPTITASLTDDDGPTGITYKWYVPKVSRPDLENDDHWTVAPTTPTGDAGQTYTADATDAGKVLRVVATYTDGAGTGNDKAYARSAHPVAAVRADNNVPQFPAGTPTSFTLGEHVAVGTVVGTVRGSDTDSGDILSHELGDVSGGDDAALFKIDMATGRITVAKKLDFESATDRDTATDGKQYGITVKVYDPTGAVPADVADRIASGAITVYITVTDQNDAPGKPDVGIQATNSRTPVDPDDNTMPSYVVDENHPVKDVVDDPDTTEVETAYAVVIATFEVDNETDPDGGDSASEGDPANTLKLTAGGVDGGLFNLTNTADFDGSDTDTTYDLMFKESPNYESPADADGNNKYHVTIVTADNEGATSELPLVITVMNVNEDGEVKLSTTQPAVGEPITATLTDPDMKITEVKWQWGRSNTRGSFIPIQGATSATYTPVMTVKDDPVTTANEGVDGDEGMYLEAKVTYVDNASADEHDPDATPPKLRTRTAVKASDNAVREAPEVNQAPMFGSGITREVPENSKENTNVGGPVTATDPDGDALAYTITGGADMGAFKIVLASGQIQVKKGTKLDFEGSQTTYVVEVTATDPFGLSASTMVTINVTDDNEKPELTLQPGGTTPPSDDTVGGRASVSVREGTSSVGTYMTTITNPTWSLTGVDRGDFSISGSGVLSFRSAPDYEAPADANGDNVYMVTVVAINGGGQRADLDVTVTVTNDPSDDQTGGTTFNPLDYDANGNGEIDRSEVITAIRAYFDNRLSRDNVLAVIRAYFAN